MEVLKSSKKAKADSFWYGKCTKCGAILSANGEELINITKGDYRSDNEDFAWEDCSYCKSKDSVCFYESNTKSGQRVYTAILNPKYVPE